jgi:hypothetical protein
MRTMPTPKMVSHMRFTVTRAVRGFSRLTSQRAKARRSAAASLGSGGKAEGVPGLTSSPRFCQLPRSWTLVTRRSFSPSSFMIGTVTGLSEASIS